MFFYNPTADPPLTLMFVFRCVETVLCISCGIVVVIIVVVWSDNLGLGSTILASFLLAASVAYLIICAIDLINYKYRRPIWFHTWIPIAIGGAIIFLVAGGYGMSLFETRKKLVAALAIVTGIVFLFDSICTLAKLFKVQGRSIQPEREKVVTIRQDIATEPRYQNMQQSEPVGFPETSDKCVQIPSSSVLRRGKLTCVCPSNDETSIRELKETTRTVAITTRTVPKIVTRHRYVAPIPEERHDGLQEESTERIRMTGPATYRGKRADFRRQGQLVPCHYYNQKQMCLQVEPTTTTQAGSTICTYEDQYFPQLSCSTCMTIESCECSTGSDVVVQQHTYQTANTPRILDTTPIKESLKDNHDVPTPSRSEEVPTLSSLFDKNDGEVQESNASLYDMLGIKICKICNTAICHCNASGLALPPPKTYRCAPATVSRETQQVYKHSDPWQSESHVSQGTDTYVVDQCSRLSQTDDEYIRDGSKKKRCKGESPKPPQISEKRVGSYTVIPAKNAAMDTERRYSVDAECSNSRSFIKDDKPKRYAENVPGISIETQAEIPRLPAETDQKLIGLEEKGDQSCQVDTIRQIHKKHKPECTCPKCCLCSARFEPTACTSQEKYLGDLSDDEESPPCITDSDSYKNKEGKRKRPTKKTSRDS